MKVQTTRILSLLGVLLVLGLLLVGILKFHLLAPPQVINSRALDPIMSTPQFEVTVVLPANRTSDLDRVFQQAEHAARWVEREMNIYNPATPLSRFNHAPANQPIRLPAETLEVLTRASDIHQMTHGAFDVTILPIIRLWKQAGKTNVLPTAVELKTARNASRWEDISLTDMQATKSLPTACVDLGGIAKGYAIDRAIASLKKSGCSAGLVNIGGDVRAFGVKAKDRPWCVVIRNPFDPGGKPIAALELRDQALCTSGNYERGSVIEGKRYSHIINPQTGQPVETWPSVSVVAPDAMTADAWATALSVLGPEGFKLLPEGVEALIISGDKEHPAFYPSEGLRDKILRIESNR